MGKWFDMRFDMDMLDGGRGMPLDILRGNSGPAELGPVDVTGGDNCFLGETGGDTPVSTELRGDSVSRCLSLPHV